MLIPSSSNLSSPCDSLSPLDDIAKVERKQDDNAMFQDVIGFMREENLFEVGRSQLPSAVPQQSQILPVLPRPYPESQPQHEPATIAASTKACPPRLTLIARDHRPSDLNLTKTNGLSTVSTSDLKQCIYEARTANDATETQLARPKADHLPQTPATPSPLIVMGNIASSIEGVQPNDNASMRSVVRNPVRMLRKSSSNLLFGKRIDSKSPLPSQLMGTIIQVRQQASPASVHEVEHELDQSHVQDTLYDEPSPDEPSDIVQPHSASTMTITAENAHQAFGAAPTGYKLQPEELCDLPVGNRNVCKQSKSESSLRQQHSMPRNLVLSPSIPAPSPLPEDSPHKYGLKDRMDTPEVPEPEEINVVKARRRSNGLEIFHEAKSLQSASSFLNGLSTSRRRAESVQRDSYRNSWNTSSNEKSRPHTSRPASRPASRPTSALQNTYSSERCRGHNFKPSGFAYARPLAMAQLKCYRSHVCMIRSGNKKAPVECAVCHIDDDEEHFSCSWCALRMCKFCRKSFAEHGLGALKERIRKAELGHMGESSSNESLGGGGRGRKAYS